MTQQTRINTVDAHLGSQLQTLRKTQGLSQQNMALKLDLPLATLSGYETGEVHIPASQLFRISQVFGVPISFFFDDLHT
jgi:transcriptional regulator with XRE-family HTH domain